MLFRSIALAKICTEKGAAMDTFFVTESQGGKVESNARQKKITERIEAALKSLTAW